MAREPVLGDDELDRELAGLAWTRSGDHLERQLRFPGFPDAIAFVNEVARIAEELDHHPDITISYNRVGLRVTTHDSGGLTGRDIALARAVDGVAGTEQSGG